MGAAGGLAWAIRASDVRCASVAHLAGAGPFVKWVTLSLKAGPGGGSHALQLASVYVPPHPAMGRSKDSIRDEVLGAVAAAAGQTAVLMGDINCDFRDENAEVRAWEQELDRSRLRGYK